MAQWQHATWPEFSQEVAIRGQEGEKAEGKETDKDRLVGEWEGKNEAGKVEKL